MPAKGKVKVKKPEKLSVSKAKAQYSLSLRLQDGAKDLCVRLAEPDFYENAIRGLALSDETKFAEFADKCAKTIRNDQLITLCCDYLVPEIQKCEDQKVALDNSIQALRDCVHVGFIEKYFKDKQYDTLPFFSLIEEVDPRPLDQRASHILGRDADEADIEI